MLSTQNTVYNVYHMPATPIIARKGEKRFLHVQWTANKKDIYATMRDEQMYIKLTNFIFV